MLITFLRRQLDLFSFFLFLTLSNVLPINRCARVVVWLLTSCSYSNLISLIYSDYWLTPPSLCGERIKPGMSKRPLSASTSDNLLQPDTAPLTGRNLPALSSHPPPSPTIIIIVVLNDIQVKKTAPCWCHTHVNNPCRCKTCKTKCHTSGLSSRFSHKGELTGVWEAVYGAAPPPN